MVHDRGVLLGAGGGGGGTPKSSLSPSSSPVSTSISPSVSPSSSPSPVSPSSSGDPRVCCDSLTVVISGITAKLGAPGDGCYPNPCNCEGLNGSYPVTLYSVGVGLIGCEGYVIFGPLECCGDSFTGSVTLGFNGGVMGPSPPLSETIQWNIVVNLVWGITQYAWSATVYTGLHAKACDVVRAAALALTMAVGLCEGGIARVE
jgi:hypothetical protein